MGTCACVPIRHTIENMHQLHMLTILVGAPVRMYRYTLTYTCELVIRCITLWRKRANKGCGSHTRKGNSAGMLGSLSPKQKPMGPECEEREHDLHHKNLPHPSLYLITTTDI
uniref:Uncharacterized protein n=1 Tax=Sphaerodactylus townsendi TaxID=933632 RepID=A0ACB8FX15_9SAUR